jgi:putative toxin-antitoxin system antitoxin component (TIGR02293 family)
VVRLGGATVQIVEARADGTLVAFGPAGGRRPRLEVGPRGVSLPSPALIEKAVERGLPRQALRQVAESLAGGDKARAASLEWGVVPKTTLERRTVQLSPQESERMVRVARLFVHARRALGMEAEAREFMTNPHPALDGRSLLDAARSDLGTRRTEQVLSALEYGLAL